MAEDFGQHRHTILNKTNDIYTTYDLALDYDDNIEYDSGNAPYNETGSRGKEHPGTVPNPQIPVNHRYATIEDLVAIFMWDYLYNNQITAIDSSGNRVKVLNDDGSYVLDSSFKDYCPTRREIEEGIEVEVNGYKVAFDGITIPKLKVNNDQIYTPYAASDESNSIPFYNENMPVRLCDVSLDNPLEYAAKPMTIVINKSLYNFTNYGETGYFDNNIVVNTTSWSTMVDTSTLDSSSYNPTSGYEYEITPIGGANFCIQTGDLLVYKVKDDFYFNAIWEVYKKLIGDTVSLPEYFKVYYEIFYEGTLLKEGMNPIIVDEYEIDYLSFVVYSNQIFANDDFSHNVIRYKDKKHYYSGEYSDVPVIIENTDTSVVQIWPDTIAIKNGDSGYTTPSNFVVTAYAAVQYGPDNPGIVYDITSNEFTNVVERKDFKRPEDPNFFPTTVVQSSFADYGTTDAINWNFQEYHFDSQGDRAAFEPQNTIYVYVNIAYYKEPPMTINITPRFNYTGVLTGELYNISGKAMFSIPEVETLYWETKNLSVANIEYYQKSVEVYKAVKVVLNFELQPLEGVITISDNLFTEPITNAEYDTIVFRFIISKKVGDNEIVYYDTTSISSITYRKESGANLNPNDFQYIQNGNYIDVLLKSPDDYFNITDTLIATITLTDNNSTSKEITRIIDTVPKDVLLFMNNMSTEYTFTSNVITPTVVILYYNSMTLEKKQLTADNITILTDYMTVEQINNAGPTYNSPWVIVFNNLAVGENKFRVANDRNDTFINGTIIYNQKYTYTFNIRTSKVHNTGHNFLKILFGVQQNMYGSLLGTTNSPNTVGSHILTVEFNDFVLSGDNEYTVISQMDNITASGLNIYNMSGPTLTTDSTKEYPILYRWYADSTSFNNGSDTWRQAVDNNGNPTTVKYELKNKAFSIFVERDSYN